MKRFFDKAFKKLVTLNSYEASASLYAKQTAPLHPKEDADRFMQRLQTKTKILDIGCGPGRDAKIFSEHGFEVVGIDFSPQMIAIAKESAPNCSFLVMDIEALNFPAESFEGAWASCALLHIPKKNMLSVLQNIHSLLKPRGSFYLSMKQSHLSETFEADHRYGGVEKYWSFYEPDELIHLLQCSAFNILDVKIAERSKEYHTHPRIKIFAEKQ